MGVAGITVVRGYRGPALVIVSPSLVRFVEDGGWVDVALFLGVLDVGGTLPPL